LRSTHHRALLPVVVVLCALLSMSRARAQSVDPAAGTLRVLVFIEAVPAGGVRVEAPTAPGAPATESNAEGSATLTLPEGPHALTLVVPRGLLPAIAADGGAATVTVAAGVIEIVGGEEIEAIVTLDGSGGVKKVDVETAASRAGDRAREAEFEQRRKAEVQGTLRGVVVSRDAGAPVAGARVFVRGTPVEAETDEAGAFRVELPVGRYDLTIIHPRFSTANLAGQVVDAARPTEVRVTVDAISAQLEDFVVTAPHIEGGVASLVAERRESASVDEIIGAEEMSRSGDGDAAGALKRVTGITVVGGQYVFVRGMGERYSATLLNGQAIPSPEPERRVIPLDLFSTDVLESVVIQKTPSPDSPGEFGGGVVQLRTTSFPTELTIGASASTGALTTATFQDRPSYRGGSYDVLGTDDGTRALPDEIRAGSPLREGNRFEPGYTTEELAAMARLLPRIYQVSDEAVPLDVGLGLTVGNAVRLAGMRGGLLLSSSYSSQHEFAEEISRRYIASNTAEDGLELNNDFLVRRSKHTISSSNIFAAGLQPADGHEIRATTLLLRITDDETSALTGRSNDLGRDIQQFRLQWVERQLLTQQVAGEHRLAGLGDGTLEWRYAYSRAGRDEPDRREYFYADEAAEGSMPDFQISGLPSANQRIWSDLVDEIHDLGLDHTQSLTVWRGLPATIKAGGTLVFRERLADTLRLTLRPPTGLTAAERRLPAEELWAEENLNASGGWLLEDTTQPTDAYRAEQDVQAGYVMATVPIRATLEVTAGARVERSRQRVTTFSPFARDEAPLIAEIDDTDVLPSASVKWQLSDQVVLRGGYGRSVTRPDFRELSRSQYRDVITATRYVGNPELVRGTIDHVDARAEYYFSTDEVASFALFFKSFADPIEQVDQGGPDRSVTWDNADSATNVGVELDGRRRLGFLDRRLENLFVAGNLALIRSEVDLGAGGGVSTSKERALQGQSPYSLNLQVGYDDAVDRGISAVALYNVSGPRIQDVGRQGTPDVFEEPTHQLDLVYGHTLGGGWKVKLKASNVLDEAVTFTQADRVTRRYKRGRGFGLSLSWNYD
jgi:outer membrane receptor protein involved in Fe transport